MNGKQNYNKYIELATKHYENFPVVSFLVPPKYKKSIALIYWFARTADDIADEEEYSSNERLQLLSCFEGDFISALELKTDKIPFNLLADTIKKNSINPLHFSRLIKAFKQDVVKKRYSNFDELLDYCSNSANPVGRIMLELYGINSEENYYFSDKICTGLQLANFIQDMSIDYNKKRIYIPDDELKNFAIDENYFANKIFDDNFKQLIKFQIDRISSIFDEGRSLIPNLSGLFKYQIAWTLRGGEEVLHKLVKNDYNIWKERPKLDKIDFLILLIKSIFNPVNNK